MYGDWGQKMGPITLDFSRFLGYNRGMTTELLTPKQAAAAMGISPSGVRRLCAAGRLGHIRIESRTVIRREDVEEFLQTCYHPPRGRRCLRGAYGAGRPGNSGAHGEHADTGNQRQTQEIA